MEGWSIGGMKNKRTLRIAVLRIGDAQWFLKKTPKEGTNTKWKRSYLKLMDKWTKPVQKGDFGKKRGRVASLLKNSLCTFY